MPFTQFTPSIHGFHFSNNDMTWSVGPVSGTVLCGGMSYASIDYFVNNMTIPHDSQAPAVGTPLNSYILQRQISAHLNTGNKFLGAWTSLPVISPLLTGFSMNVDTEFATLVAKLSTGKPIPICLVGSYHGHHLVAIGCNPTPPITITVYDPNVPGKTAFVQELVLEVRKFRNSQSSKIWDSFFVDTGYVPMIPTVPAGQAQWRWCNVCQALFFDGHATKGVCPKGGGSHRALFSANYWLGNSGLGQPNWRWCRVCEALFFAGNNSFGVCPANPSGHDGSQSANYVLTLGSGAGQQAGWGWCRMCQGLFFLGAGSLGVCPKNPNGHDGTQSGNYILSVTTG